jgi:hypothetical protein
MGWAARPLGTRRPSPGPLPLPPVLLDDNHLPLSRFRSGVDNPLPPVAVVLTGWHGQPEGQRHVSQRLDVGKLHADPVLTLGHPLGSGTPQHQRRIIPSAHLKGQPTGRS